jgi:thioredoxin 1
MRKMTMKRFGIFTVAYLSLLVLAVSLQAAEKSSTVSSSLPKPQTVNELNPGLTIGALTYAVASELPKGVLLKAGNLFINNKDINEQIAKAPEQVRPKLEKNAFFVLEQMATFKLLLAEAKADAAKSDKDIPQKNDQTIIQDYLPTLVKNVEVGDSEILYFYNNNKETLGGASLAQVKPQIGQFLLQQKQQEFINKYIQTIGQRMQIEISAPWLKVQAALAKDNPVDKARDTGKPSLVDFGSTGCVPCDMLAPILDTLREKYKGKLNVLFIHVGQEPILAGRYGIQAIPVQIFFDKTGKEVFRHVGFFPQEQIEAKLSKMGVK